MVINCGSGDRRTAGYRRRAPFRTAAVSCRPISQHPAICRREEGVLRWLQTQGRCAPCPSTRGDSAASVLPDPVTVSLFLTAAAAAAADAAPVGSRQMIYLAVDSFAVETPERPIATCPITTAPATYCIRYHSLGG